MIGKLSGYLFFPLMFLALTWGGAAYNLALEGRRMAGEISRIPPAEGLGGQMRAISGLAESRVTGRDQWLDLYYRLQRLMGQRSFNNFRVVLTAEGDLNFGGFSLPEDWRHLRAQASYYREINERIKAGGGRLVFYHPLIRPIGPAGGAEPGLPSLDLNPRADFFLNCLREYGVDFIDARYGPPGLTASPNGLEEDQARRRPPLPPHWRPLYRTDVQWTSEAAFMAFQHLVDEVEKRWGGDRLPGLNLDPEGFYRNPENYYFRVYQDLFLGNLGLMTSRQLAGLDDFTAIRPKFAGDFIVETVDDGFGFMRREGPARLSLYYDSRLVPPDPPRGLKYRGDAEVFRPYNFYLLGLHSMVTIKNKENPDGPRLLLVSDPFGVPLGCFLAPLAGELVIINPQASGYAPELMNYVSEKNFDLAIILQSMYTL